MSAESIVRTYFLVFGLMCSGRNSAKLGGYGDAGSIAVFHHHARSRTVPSWLQQSVDVNASEHVRLSVSLNIMFSNYTSELCKPLRVGATTSHMQHAMLHLDGDSRRS